MAAVLVLVVRLGVQVQCGVHEGVRGLWAPILALPCLALP